MESLCLAKSTAFAAKTPPQRVEFIRQFQFYSAFYLISITTFNAAAAFCIGQFFLSWCSSHFAPLLLRQIWISLLVSSGIVGLLIGTFARRILYR